LLEMLMQNGSHVGR